MYATVRLQVCSPQHDVGMCSQRKMLYVYDQARETRKKAAPQRPHAHPHRPAAHPPHESHEQLFRLHVKREAPRAGSTPRHPRRGHLFDLVFFSPRALAATVCGPPSPTPLSAAPPAQARLCLWFAGDHCVTPAVPRGLGRLSGHGPTAHGFALCLWDWRRAAAGQAVRPFTLEK